jgi:hypothetical protein
MRRLARAVRFGLLNSLVLCVAVTAMRGFHDGWDSIRLANPPTPEVAFYLVLAAIQTVFGWTLIGPGGSDAKAPGREL